MIKVMVAGLPGNMATLVAKAVKKAKDMKLLPFALAEEEGESRFGRTSVIHVPLSIHKEQMLELSPDIIVDFTTAAAVNRNAESYCECKIPFVMGTTGGDRDLLKKTVEDSDISAVIAPNMLKQIVVLQDMLEYAADEFPGSFEGFTLEIVESHQQKKVDTSGTAKAMVKSFNELGIPFEVDQIVKIRDPQAQEKELGVPDWALGGHGWHTYNLSSPDGSVFIQIVHNVNGRNGYIPGILDAIRFLDEMSEIGGIVYDMADVLR